MTTALTIIAFLVLLGLSAVGFVLALITLPGTWLILLGGIVINYGLPHVAPLLGRDMPQLIDDKTLIAMVVVALLAEVIEFVASAAGAKKAGGGKSGAIFSIVGGFVGAIAGQIFIPIPLVGAVIGGVVGAGVGAVLGERHFGKKTWGQAARVGQGAAAGRAIATVVKAAAAAIIGLTLMIAVWL